MCSNISSWQTKTNPLCSVFSLQQWKHKMLALCTVMTPWGRQIYSDVFLFCCLFVCFFVCWFKDRQWHQCDNKRSALLLLLCALHFISLSEMLGKGDDIYNQITFRHLHSNVSSSPEYESTPSLSLANPPPPTSLIPASTLLVSYAFQH